MTWREGLPVTLINDLRHVCDIRWSELQLGLLMNRQMPQAWTSTESDYWETKNAIMIDTKDYKLPWE